jgi:hypothetical protein
MSLKEKSTTPRTPIQKKEEKRNKIKRKRKRRRNKMIS